MDTVFEIMELLGLFSPLPCARDRARQEQTDPANPQTVGILSGTTGRQAAKQEEGEPT